MFLATKRFDLWLQDAEVTSSIFIYLYTQSTVEAEFKLYCDLLEKLEGFDVESTGGKQILQCILTHRGARRQGNIKSQTVLTPVFTQR